MSGVSHFCAWQIESKFPAEQCSIGCARRRTVRLEDLKGKVFRMFRSVFSFGMITACVVTALPALAATMTPSQVVAKAASLDGTTVTVSGKVAKFQRQSTLMGTVSAYQLCDSACVVVIDQRNGTQSNGQTATVSGTFHTQYKAPRRSFKNVVMISK